MRKTAIPSNLEVFSTQFSTLKQKQWDMYRRRLDQDIIPDSFYNIIADISEFLSPIINRMNGMTTSCDYWIAPGPWVVSP